KKSDSRDHSRTPAPESIPDSPPEFPIACRPARFSSVRAQVGPISGRLETSGQPLHQPRDAVFPTTGSLCEYVRFADDRHGPACPVVRIVKQFSREMLGLVLPRQDEDYIIELRALTLVYGHGPGQFMRRQPAVGNFANTVPVGKASDEPVVAVPQNADVTIEKGDVVVVSGDEDGFALV